MDSRDLIEELAGDGSLRALARRAGVPKTTIIEVHAGKELSLRALRQLARAFPERRDLFLLFFSENVLNTAHPSGETFR